MRTIIRGARVLTMDGAGTELAAATVTIEGDTIVAVEAMDAGGAADPGRAGNASAGTGGASSAGVASRAGVAAPPARPRPAGQRERDELSLRSLPRGQSASPCLPRSGL